MILLILSMFSFPVVNADDNIILVKNSNDYLKHGFKDLGIYYTPNGLTSFDMPFIIYKSNINSLSKSELSYDFEISKSKNYESFERLNPLISSSIIGENEKYYIVNYHMDIKASDNYFNIDFIPEIKNVKYNQFAWWNNTFFKKIKITIDHTQVMEDLYNFPLLVVTGESINNDCQSDGGDLRFTDSTETNEFYYDIELWRNDGNSFIFVNISSISSSVDTEFYMYYNNSDCENGENKDLTYNSDFSAVWHMNYTGGIVDNSANPGCYVLTAQNNPSAVNGLVGNAVDLTSATNDYFCELSTFYDVFPSSCTYVCLADSDSDALKTIMCKYQSSGSFQGQMEIYFNPTSFDVACRVRSSSADRYVVFPGGGSIDKWHMMGISYVASSQHLGFCDGCSKTGLTATVGNGALNPFSVGCMHDGTPERWFDGQIDEVWCLNASMSQEWLTTIYNSWFNQSTFISFGEIIDIGYICPNIYITNENPENNSIDVSYLNQNFSVLINISNGQSFNYSIKLYHNNDSLINETSENNVYNGTKTLSIGEVLSGNTEYYWVVKIDLNCSYLIERYNFTTGISGCPCEEEFRLLYEKLDEISDILEGDNMIVLDATQFSILIYIILYIVFTCIGFFNEKNAYGMFVIIGGMILIPFSLTVSIDPIISKVIGGFGIVQLILGIKKLFSVAEPTDDEKRNKK